MNRPFSFLGAVLLGLMTGCSSASKSDSAGRPATASELTFLAEQDLTVTRLVAWGQTVTLPTDRPPTVRLSGTNRIAGFAGVNRFNGTWHLIQPGRIQWSPAMVSSRMAGPPERMQLEDTFMKALLGTTRLTVTDHGVRFSSEDSSNLVEARR